ncbi:MAG: hypothetical protein KF791_12265 [Verrucomicrobiae bacterium]|nr:hypothetical protein [Verrucomicrobiae bacterium]
MNRSSALPALMVGVCGVSLLRAQVDVDLAMERDAFLPAEPVEVSVRFANFTGAPLTLGADAEWIQFTVEGVDGRVVTKRSDPPETGEFTLEQATRGKLRWNLTPLFSLEDPGMYRVYATVSLPDGDLQTTTPKVFEIVPGVALHEPREVGVRLPDGTTDRRKYILQQVNFLKKLQLYLRITDPTESRTHAIIALGPTVNFDRPQWVVDRETRFHVLHRATGDLYAYHIFQGDGSLQTRQLWQGDPRPDLVFVNDAGEVGVRRGRRRPDPSDIPAVLPAKSPGPAAAAEIPPPEVPPTNSTSDAPPPPP